MLMLFQFLKKFRKNRDFYSIKIKFLITGTRYMFHSTFLHKPVVFRLTVMPTKSDSDVTFCLQLFSKTLTFTLHLSLREPMDHLCIKTIRGIGLIHK